MLRQSVVSTELRSIGYDQETRALEVEFNRGGIYRYLCVPSYVHSGLMSAPSKGRYFNAHIKDTYSYQRVA
jgi:KTSC domain